MALAPGTRLGAYEILMLIGSGGMGEVYRARDTKLNRDVAIKVLPESLASDSERLARFEREAKTLAALNHPNIAHIHGFEDSTGTLALVMELVEGPTLADRIARGPIPLDEALPIAKQIAEALETAHEQDIIHRDLKPANIKLRDDGTVKILDFGLAKALEPKQAFSVNVTQSPTITTPAMITGIGMVLGTAAYMSPEQAKGRPADKRSDIWAFGCVLFEVLTGKRAFDGDDVSETLASVLRSEPDWTLLSEDVPVSMRAALRGCLEKDPRRRVRDVSTIPFLIEAPEFTRRHADVAAHTRPRRRLAVAVGFAAVVASAVAGTVVWNATRAPVSGAVVRLSMALSDNEQFGSTGLRAVAISPDGSHIVYAASRRLFSRSMSDAVAAPIRGTETDGDIGTPAFSPDGQSIVFFVATGRNTAASDLRRLLPRGAIRRIALGGGTATTLCEADLPFGISWYRDGIVFGQLGKGVMRVAATGGEPELLASVKDGAVPLDPQMLPGGKAILFTEVNGVGLRLRLEDDLSRTAVIWDKGRIVVQTLTTGEQRTLIDGGSAARYVGTGHIVFALAGTLHGAPFDVRGLTLSGRAVPLVEGVARTRYAALPTGSAHFAVSDTGTLVYLPGPVVVAESPPRDIGMFGRDGATEPLKLPPMHYEFPRLSPDGQQLAVSTDDGRVAQIWISDVKGSGPPRQLTFQGRNRYPLWSADGRRVTFQSDAAGDLGIFWQAADGRSAAERLTKAERHATHIPQAWSPNGETLLFSVESQSAFSLWTFSARDHTTGPFDAVRSSTIPPAAAFSPDGRWVSYQSGEIPDPRIFVQPFPATGALYQASTYGRHPRWSHDGRYLFFTQANHLLSTSVTYEPTIRFGNPTPIVTLAGATTIGMQRAYDVTRDGARFLAPITGAGFTPLSTLGIRQVNVVLNWVEELKARVPAK